MHNKKMIVINGLERGGTTFLWTLLRSHPQICSTSPLETGQIVDNLPLKPERLKQFARRAIRSSKATKQPYIYLVGPLFDWWLAHLKMNTLNQPDSRYKAEGVLYTQKEVRESVICMKGVNDDVFLNPLFLRVYRDCTLIGLVRDGYAVCEGWLRRGRTAKEAGVYYRRCVSRMIEDADEYDRCTVVKFETVLKDPFGVATPLFELAGVEPISLPKLMVKSRKVLQPDGSYAQKSEGFESRKYWLDTENIQKLISSDISDIQRASLSEKDRSVFAAEAGDCMLHFDYGI